MGIKDWQGGVIVKNPVTPSGPYENSTASGMWTMNQVADYTKQGIWPTAGRQEPDVVEVFSTYLYDGTNATQTITNGIDLAGEGGLVWQKLRTHPTPPDGQDHYLRDTERGGGYSLESNTTDAQFGDDGGITAFNSNGFSLGTATRGNQNGATYASWTFRKAPKFFDVVTYTGTGVAGLTVSHNLGSVPGMILLKRTDTSSGWRVYHRSANGGTNPEQYYAMLQSTNAFAVASTVWNNTAPTDSVFTVGTDGDSNTNNGTYVAYLFAHETDAASFIQCGSLTVSAQATVSVDLGYEAQWVMLKRSDGTGNWFMFDVIRGMAIDSFEWLYANLSSVAEEKSYQAVFPTATGFSFNPANNGQLTDGDYIYTAIRAPMMIAPTSATEVFAPNFYGTNGYVGYLGAPADMHMLGYRSGNSQNSMVSSRMIQGNKALVTSSTAAEITSSSSWDNMSGVTPVGSTLTTLISWTWKRAKSYLDVVAYTGTGSTRTVAHSLGAAPEMMWFKGRNQSAYNWMVYHKNISPANGMYLSDSGAASGASFQFANTAPTATVFTVGSGVDVNSSNEPYIAYLFATAPGVSKLGSYTGTGNDLNVDCGFTGGARFILIKRTDATGDWYVWDSVRGIVSGNDPYLLLNSTAAEVTNTDYVDPLNVGFTVTSSAPTSLNANNGNYIFYAIA